MKTMLFAILLFSFGAQAQKLTYKDTVDAINTWEYSDQADFHRDLVLLNDKCKYEIIKRTQDRIAYLNVATDDFTYETELIKKDYKKFGSSYQCELTVAAKKNSLYSFSAPKYSPMFFDILDPKTNEVIKSDVDQCKEYIDELELNAQSTKLFSRHAELAWATNRKTGKYVQFCQVKYINLKSTK